MSRFRQHAEFESRFAEMDVAELRRWKTYWTKHAQSLGPKVRKIAMKRVHRIDAATARRLNKDGSPLRGSESN
jgi:hypothetical protein